MKNRVAALIFVLALPCAAWAGDVQQVKPLKIGVATFSHETCTFCPRPTGVDEWEFYGPPERGEAVLEASSYIRGFVSQVREFGGVELVGLLSPRNAVGGSSGSWITKEAFDKYTGGIVKDLEEQGPFDGVFLALHGAMAVTGVPRPEAEIARRVRAAVGDIPIVATFDLHGNEDEEFLAVADGTFTVKRYPHYDARLQGDSRNLQANHRDQKTRRDHAQRVPGNRSLPGAGHHGTGETVGVPQIRRFRFGLLRLRLRRCARCGSNGECHDQRQPGARERDRR